jgi:type IV secretion system protein VirD4
MIFVLVCLALLLLLFALTPASLVNLAAHNARADLAFLFLVVLVVWFYHAVIGHRAQVRRRARALRWRTQLRLRPGPGYASLTELWRRWGRLAALSHGRRSRPGLRLRHRLFLPTTHYAVRYGRAQYGRRAYGREEEQTLVLSPPRVGKTALLADEILSHRGALLATTTRGDLYMLTAAARASQGPVDVFNPQGVGSIPSTFAWHMLDACRDVLMAQRMAHWLTGGITSRAGHGDLEWFEAKGDVAFRALLWAAAVGGYSITDVYRWVMLDGHRAALDVLAEHPDSSPEMLAIARRAFSENRTHDSIRATMELSLAWAAIPQLAAAVTPGTAYGFDLDRFLACDGSMYLVASGDEDSPLTPLFRAFASWLHYSAGLAGTLTPAGRLPRLLFEAWDELATICPVDLPSMLADSAGKGIRMTVVAHDKSQLAERWGDHGAKTIWALCSTKILFGGIQDADTLDEVSRLCGTVMIGRGDSPVDSVQVAPIDFLRTLPQSWALILRGALSPVVVRTRPAWKRIDYRLARLGLSLRRPPAPVQVPAPAEVPTLELANVGADGDTAPEFPHAGPSIPDSWLAKTSDDRS